MKYVVLHGFNVTQKVTLGLFIPMHLTDQQNAFHFNFLGQDDQSVIIFFWKYGLDLSITCKH